MSSTKECGCLRKTEAYLLTHLKEKLSKKKKIARFNESDAHYQNVAIMFSGPMSRRLYFTYELPYTPIKADGTDGKERIEKVNMFPTFCPFCGKEYPKDKS